MIDRVSIRNKSIKQVSKIERKNAAQQRIVFCVYAKGVFIDLRLNYDPKSSYRYSRQVQCVRKSLHFS